MSRIKGAARSVGGKWYQAWGKNFGKAFNLDASLKRNERWIKKKIKECYKIVDIGIDPRRATRSPFYALEQEVIKKAGYPVTRLSWP